MLRYSVLRLFVFFAVILILFLCQLRGWPLLVLAAFISSVISLVALRGPREQFADQIDQKVTARRIKADEYRTAEDDD